MRLPSMLLATAAATATSATDSTATATSATDSHWVYAASASSSSSNAADQAATWPSLCVEGRLQSPINIITTEAAAAPALSDGLQPKLSATPLTLMTTGHNLQAVPSASMCTTIRGDEWAFAQVHWHTPSENTVDSKSFAMEAHFVHTLVADPSKLAVVAVLFEQADACNPTLDALPWSAFGVHGEGSVPSNGAIDLTPLLSSEMLSAGYYHWTGSVTTPPCTEGVDWNLLKATQTVCAAQVERLRTALASTQQGVAFNNRAVQALNQRVVTQTPGGDGGGRLFFLPNFDGANLVWLILVAVVGCCGWCVARAHTVPPALPHCICALFFSLWHAALFVLQVRRLPPVVFTAREQDEQ